jgi:hypothetical protein
MSLVTHSLAAICLRRMPKWSELRDVFSANLSKRVAVVGIAVSAISLPTASFALGTTEERSACTGDVFRLCSSEIPNVDRIVVCLKSNKASLSTACRSVFDRPAAQSVAR